MKELPATLVLRPFDFSTLAVRAFEMASDERLADAGHAGTDDSCGWAYSGRDAVPGAA